MSPRVRGGKSGVGEKTLRDSRILQQADACGVVAGRGRDGDGLDFHQPIAPALLGAFPNPDYGAGGRAVGPLDSTPARSM
jgi:hypothetical protein